MAKTKSEQEDDIKKINQANKLNEASYDVIAAAAAEANAKPLGEKSGPLVNIESDYSKI